MAPEVITHQHYDHRCDVFSFGVLLWEIYHQEIPFCKESGLQAAFAVAMERKRPRIALPAPLDLLAPLIQLCWSHEPMSRPPMSRVVADIVAANAKVEASVLLPSSSDEAVLFQPPVLPRESPTV